jgi:hypothetical protein
VETNSFKQFEQMGDLSPSAFVVLLSEKLDIFRQVWGKNWGKIGVKSDKA